MINQTDDCSKYFPPYYRVEYDGCYSTVVRTPLREDGLSFAAAKRDLRTYLVSQRTAWTEATKLARRLTADECEVTP